MPREDAWTDVRRSPAIAETVINLLSSVKDAEEDLTELATDIEAEAETNVSQQAQIDTHTSEIASLKTRMTNAEAQNAANASSIVTIQARLNLVNALLHLW